MRTLISRAGGPILAAFLCGACAGPAQQDRGPEVGPGADDFTSRLIPISKSQQPQWDETATLEDRLRHYKVPGVGIAVIDNFEIVGAEGFGSLRAEGNRAVDSDTLFHAGSVAKPVSTAAVLTLVDGGVLDLDSNVNDVLVSWKIPENQFTMQE